MDNQSDVVANASPVSDRPVDDLCEHFRATATGDVDLLCDFTREFVGKATRQLVRERSIAARAALTVGAFRFLQQSRPDQVNVQVLDPATEGWEAPITLLRAQVGDRPFVVDTIREYLTSEGITIHRFIHPVLNVERDAAGELVRVGGTDGGDAEALVHCEMSRLASAERREEIRAGVEARLQDVVAVTDDFQPMLGELRDTIEMVRGAGRRLPARAGEFRELEEFLRWLREENFVLLGYREYTIRGEADRSTLEIERGSGLGILREEGRSAWAQPVSLESVSEELRSRILGGPMLIISKTNAESTVHRRARMDYIGVKKLDDSGRVAGERRFLGLFTSKAYSEPADEIPLLRDKLDRILRQSGVPPGSHDYKEIITIFNSLPKEELFQASTDELFVEVQTVLNFLFADQVQVTLRPDPLGRGVNVMVILPRGRFSGDVRRQIQDALVHRFQGMLLDYHLSMSAGDQARLHFALASPGDLVRQTGPREIETDIRDIILTWQDRLRIALEAEIGADEARRLADLFGPAFSDEYVAATLPDDAVDDVLELERLRVENRRVTILLRQPSRTERIDAGLTASDLDLYLVGERLILSDFMPTLDNAGLRVVEVTPFMVSAQGLPECMIYSFAVQRPDGATVPPVLADTIAEMLLAVRNGDVADDPFNALVLAAGLRWREADVLRTYANYAFQIRAIPTRGGPARALARYPAIARLLFDLFRERFEGSGSPETAASIVASLMHELEAVETLADDRAFRTLIGLIEGTTRTNYFKHGGADPTFRSGGVPYISLKFRSADIPELRKSPLMYEIFVYSSRMEGIHLRAAPVSRGGIRWSDRPDDFRTEIMGLVQTQIVKNAVIVPSGSKGGFVIKRTFPGRDEAFREATEQYRTLMRGMLDITDNFVDGSVVPPAGVVRYDEDDPYLVVAADKGTAHLSDVANEISAEYGFWLGDAFASGGSQGYDHKEQGITARGGWESVKRHFREMGGDTRTEPFTVVGIGDMSGDVFGNGMLRSRCIRLIAAFDHRHIFIDPDPDPERSFVERQRLYDLPRSSWADYDRSLLSAGAMVVSRTAKEVELTPEAVRALGLDAAASRLDGEALVRAVLRAPVDLLWNGGIGTYVKAAEETHAEVGDSSNDPVRVNAEELRCRVVGEGGNLGFTQRARIAYALGGGRINTDALDNSGGVDMSDHEVNLKILFGPSVAAGEMTLEARNRLLQEMTDDVSALVLSDNISQTRAVSLDESRSRESLADFDALIAAFEHENMLERAADGIPGRQEIAERAKAGLGLTRPTLSVLMAYTKLHATSRLLASSVPDDPTVAEYLERYFPAAAIEGVGRDRLLQHRLRREIIVTGLVSDLVDLMGTSFLFRVARDGGDEIEEVVWAWDIASRISGARGIREDLAGLEEKFPADTIYRWFFALARVLERTTRWVLNNVEPGTPAAVVLAEHLSDLSRLRGDFHGIVVGEHRQIFAERMLELKELGVDEPFAARLITLRFLPELLDIVRIAKEARTDAVATARAYYLVAEHFSIPWLQQAIRSSIHDQVWDKRLSQALLADVARAHRAIGRSVLACEAGSGNMVSCVEGYETQHPRAAEVYREVLEDLHGAEQVPLAGYAVAVRALGDLADD